jgi:hypothetical protein
LHITFVFGFFCKPSSDGTRKFGWFWGVGQIEGLILHRHFYGGLEGFYWESGQGIGRPGERRSEIQTLYARFGRSVLKKPPI